MTGISKRQLDTWDKSKGFQTRLIRGIREKLQEKIARERNPGVERTMGYSDNLEALRQKFGMGSGGGRLPIHSISGRRSGGYKWAGQLGGPGPAALNGIVID